MTWNDIPRDPPRHTLRQFGGLCLAVFGLLAWHWLGRGASLAGWTAALLAGLGAAGVAHPPLLKPVFVGWLVLVFPVGWLVSRVLLLAIWLGLFVPMALVFRLAARDALRLRRPAAESFWVPRPAPAAAESYYRQF